MPFTQPENKQDEDIAEQAIAWFSRLQSANVTADEKMQFLSWQGQSAQHKQAYEEITLLLDDADFNLALNEARLSKQTTQKKHKPNNYRLSLATAACLALFVVLFDPITRLQADYQTAVGEQQVIQLSDGSQVTLNTDTALAIDFNSQQRRVSLLKGEAYFAVSRDKNKPFIIDSGETETRVIGTKFIVKINPSGDKITVLEGQVKVSSLPHQQSVQLHPDQQVINLQSGLSNVSQVIIDDETSWLKNRLIYKNQPLAKVIAELENYLPGMIYINDKSLNNYKINARLDISKPKAALKALQQTLPITITQISPWLTIINKKM